MRNVPAFCIAAALAGAAFAQDNGRTGVAESTRAYTSTGTIPGGAPGGSPGSAADPRRQCPVAVFTGRVVSTDWRRKALTVAGPEGETRTFTLAQTTSITGPGGEPMVLEDLEPGSLVRVSYTGPAKAPASIICIEVPPGPGQ